MPAWTSAYVELHTLNDGHSDTINYLSFSSDGIYLASCSDDQSLIVWNIAEGRLLYRVLFRSKVDRVIWHPAYPATLVVGCDNGYLYQLHEFSPVGGEKTQIELGVRGTIHCLAYERESRCLAVGLGSDVYLTREAEQNRYEGVYKFPSPPTLPLASSTSPEPRESRLRPVDIHFMKAGEHLLAAYLAHGIVCWDIRSQTTLWTFTPASLPYTIGSSALSPRGDEFAVYNLVDGVDVYSIKPGGIKRKPRRVLKHPRKPRTKHALLIAYIIDGRGLVCGTTTGDVCVWDAANGEVYQVLTHDKDEIIQAVAGTSRGQYSYIATASVDKGQATYIKVWRAKYDHQNDVAFKSKVYQAVRVMKESNEFSRSKDVMRRWILPSLCVISIALCLHWLSSSLPWPVIWIACSSTMSAVGEYVRYSSYSVASTAVAMYRAACDWTKLFVHETLEALRIQLVLWLRVDEVLVARPPRQ